MSENIVRSIAACLAMAAVTGSIVVLVWLLEGGLTELLKRIFNQVA